MLGLTDRRLVFLPIAGEQSSLPVVRVSAVRVEDRRRDAAATHRHRLVVLVDDGAEHASAGVDDAAARWRSRPGVRAVVRGAGGAAPFRPRPSGVHPAPAAPRGRRRRFSSREVVRGLAELAVVRPFSSTESGTRIEPNALISFRMRKVAPNA